MKDESYTPDWLIKSVTDVLGVIELDPTANGQVNHGVHNLTQSDNCFIQDCSKFLIYHKTVFMNPPYSNGGLFLSEMYKYLDKGSLDYAITLTLPGLMHNKKSSLLFSTCFCKSLALPIGRINFENNGNSNDRDSLITLWSRFDDKTNVFQMVFRNLTSPLKTRSKVPRVKGCLILTPQIHNGVESIQNSLTFDT